MHIDNCNMLLQTHVVSPLLIFHLHLVYTTSLPIITIITDNNNLLVSTPANFKAYYQ
jgi:hypothetical protein